MKKTLFVFTTMLFSITVLAQNNPEKINNLSNFNNTSSMHFLKPMEIARSCFSLNTKPGWRAKQFNDEYNQLVAINRKKELYPLLLMDSRFVNQAMPARYSSQNYIWVSTPYSFRSFGETVATDIIYGFVNSKTKKYGLNFKPAEKGYYTPVGMKY